MAAPFQGIVRQHEPCAAKWGIIASEYGGPKDRHTMMSHEVSIMSELHKSMGLSFMVLFVMITVPVYGATRHNRI